MNITDSTAQTVFRSMDAIQASSTDSATGARLALIELLPLIEFMDQSPTVTGPIAVAIVDHLTGLLPILLEYRLGADAEADRAAFVAQFVDSGKGARAWFDTAAFMRRKALHNRTVRELEEIRRRVNDFEAMAGGVKGAVPPPAILCGFENEWSHVKAVLAECLSATPDLSGLIAAA